MAKQLTREDFKILLPLICDKETSSNPDNWMPGNPLWGHCAVVSVLAQDIFGGELLRASLLNYPEFALMGSHYCNRLPDGTHEDFTASQFGNYYPINLVAEPRDRSYVLSNLGTATRYALLAERFRIFLKTNA